MGSDYASIWLSEDITGDLVRRAIYIKPEEQVYLNMGIERLKSNDMSINMTAFKEKRGSYSRDVNQAKVRAVIIEFMKKPDLKFLYL